MMKILHVLYQSIPNSAGSSIRSRDLINSQLKLGLTPIVITSPFQEPLNKNFEREEIDGIIYYRTFSNNKNEIITEKKTNIFLQFRKALRLLSFINIVFKVAKKENIDIIHAHAMFFCAIAAKVSSIRLGVPILYEVRSLWEERYMGLSFFNDLIFSFVSILETLSMYLCDHLIVINENLRHTLSKRFLLSKQSFSIVPNGVDLSRVNIVKSNNDNLVFAYIGTVSPIEGLDVLIQVFNNLFKQGLKNKLLIFGDGIELNKLIVLSNNNPLIEFKGRFLQTDISQIYSQIDVVVNPRISNFLTNSVTPLKPLEAMAYKKLVIASNIGGMRELIEHNKTGLLFKPESYIELEQTILDVLELKNFENIISESHKYILNNKSWDNNAKLYMQIYTKLIDDK